LAGFALLPGGRLLQAEDQPTTVPATAAGVFEDAIRHPLTRQTWPVWREIYIKIFFEDVRNPEQEKWFYEQVRAFFGATAAAAGGSLPDEFAGDPMAWVALAWTYWHRAGEQAGPGGRFEKDLAAAETASRKANALGDPQAIASYSLATFLISSGLFRGPNQLPDPGIERRLAEAEERLQHVERISPRAKLSLWRGYIAQLRGDARSAGSLFRRATEDHPDDAFAAFSYLMNAIQTAQPSDRLSELSGPFVDRFPRESRIVALHAVALERDERFPEAAETLRRARGLDEKVVQFLGEDTVKAIEESGHLSARALGGLKALKADQYDTAAAELRQALADDPGNLLAARGLARALVEGLASGNRRLLPGAADQVADEVSNLCRRFPDDAEMQVGLALSLHLAKQHIRAARALDRAVQLGGSPAALLGGAGVEAIHSDAAQAEWTRFWTVVAVAVVGGAALWTAIMFALGVILAVSIPRVPEATALTAGSRSRREVWLERFYLLVLSLGLLMFYASVPVVVLGLVAVTLAAFVLMLVIRIIHLGVLHRGLWATCNIVRCTLMGPSRRTLGIEATPERHPRLFETLRTVAARLHTRPVDAVYLTPSSSIAVYQEGAGPFGLLGRRRRVLDIGISTLPLLTRSEFQSILAHEYGHFTQNDPFYSRFIFQVSASLTTSLAVMSAAGGFLNHINPFYWFWWLYLRAYTLLANGFSRSREFLADREAVAAYGKRPFVSGLTKASVDGVLFESTVYVNIQHQLGQGRTFINIFDAFRQHRQGTEMTESRERLLEQLRRQKPRWLDTHPTFSERIAAVSHFPDAGLPDEDPPASELLDDPQAMEAELTNVLTYYVHQSAHGTATPPTDTSGEEG
jgi:Zn-dependent protease with chaperone function/tetratricopeptide (TPR) repeat protein